MGPLTAEGWAQVVGGFATAIAAAIALAAVILAFCQISINRRQAHETLAMEAYRALLQMCFEHPQYSSAELYAKDVKLCRNVQEINLGEESVESERYLWFLSILLNTCEEILESVAPDPAWEAVIGVQLSYHEYSLQILWPEWYKYYGDELQQRVNLLLAEALGLTWCISCRKVRGAHNGAFGPECQCDASKSKPLTGKRTGL
jgi:hypothetical protein